MAGLLFETDGPALVAGVSDLDGTGIAQRLVNQEVSDFRGFAIGLEIYCFDECFWPLALVGFSKAGDGASERECCARVVVPVVSAKPGSRDEERAWPADLLIQCAHCNVQRFHPQANGFTPTGRVERAEVAFVVERREPIDSRDWLGGHPPFKSAGEGVGIGSTFDAEHLDAQGAQALRQGFRHATSVGHDHDTASVIEFTPEGLQNVSGGRKVATGTRRGT